MKDIQKRELIRSIKLIQALGCSFHIITPDGESFGDLEVVKPKPPRLRAERKYPYGSLTEHLRECIDLNAAVGTVQEVPRGRFDVATLRSTASSFLTRAWGPDTYVTGAKENHFEVLRTADKPTGEDA